MIWIMAVLSAAMNIALLSLAILVAVKLASGAQSIGVSLFIIVLLLGFAGFFGTLAWRLIRPTGRGHAVSPGTWKAVGLMFALSAAGLFLIIAITGAWLHIAAPLLAGMFAQWCFTAAGLDGACEKRDQSRF